MIVEMKCPNCEEYLSLTELTLLVDNRPKRANFTHSCICPNCGILLSTDLMYGFIYGHTKNDEPCYIKSCRKCYKIVREDIYKLIKYFKFGFIFCNGSEHISNVDHTHNEIYTITILAQMNLGEIENQFEVHKVEECHC